MDEKIPQSLLDLIRSKVPINLLERIGREAEKLVGKDLNREDWEEAGNLMIDILFYMTVCRPGQVKDDLGFLRVMLKEIKKRVSLHMGEGEGKR